MPDQKQSILLGALVTAVLSTSYLGLINCLCCAGVIIGSVTAVWHYTNRYRITIEPGRGAVLGLIAAALGSVIALLLNYVLMNAGVGGQEVIYDFFLGLFSDSMPEAQLEQMEEQFEAQRNIGFGAYLLNGLIGVAVSAIFGAIGGAIGASIFKKGGEVAGTEEW